MECNGWKNTNIHHGSKTLNETENSTRISGYNHNIFKNITFAKSNGTQVYETFPFGDYVTSATAFAFLLTGEMQ
jgi:hypothetical protein